MEYAAPDINRISFELLPTQFLFRESTFQLPVLWSRSGFLKPVLILEMVLRWPQGCEILEKGPISIQWWFVI